MQEERMRILSMVREGLLTPTDAADLLAALGSGAAAPQAAASLPASPATTVDAGKRWFRLRVTDAANGRVKVNLSLPISLLDFGLRMGGLGAEIENFRSALYDAPGGKLLEVDDGEGSERVEMFVE